MSPQVEFPSRNPVSAITDDHRPVLWSRTYRTIIDFDFHTRNQIWYLQSEVFWEPCDGRQQLPWARRLEVKTDPEEASTPKLSTLTRHSSRLIRWLSILRIYRTVLLTRLPLFRWCFAGGWLISFRYGLLCLNNKRRHRRVRHFEDDVTEEEGEGKSERSSDSCSRSISEESSSRIEGVLNEIARTMNFGWWVQTWLDDG